MTKPLSFPDKHPDEIVVFIQRRHWSVLFGRMVRWVFLLLLPMVAVVIVSLSGTTDALTSGSAGSVALVLGMSVFALVVLLLAFQDWLDYYLDMLILSNERVIQIEQVGLFKRTVSQLSLDKVQDVTVETKGMSSSLFGFGSITIESAGEQENFVIHNVPHVERVQSQILMYAKQAPRSGVERQSPPGKPGTTPPTTGTPSGA